MDDRTHAADDTEGLIRPQKVLWDVRQVMGPSDIVLSDVGAHKMWIARYYHCHEPNTCLIPNENVRLCAPVFAELSGNAGETKQFEIAMVDSCEFGVRAFLGFNFFSDGAACPTDTTRPELVFGDPPCPLCNIWNIFVSPPDKDLCFDDPLGLPVMYATVSSCYTPTIPRSWGQLKAIYRRPR